VVLSVVSAAIFSIPQGAPQAGRGMVKREFETGSRSGDKRRKALQERQRESTAIAD